MVFAAQVYETSGSPVTVVSNVGTNGTSVSPSLWAPHAYAPNAPYPSPPTGPQVPPAFAPDHAAYLAQQAGPIYSAPPPFIQDPTMMNYNTGAPPFAPAYHPQAGYQGFPQVVSILCLLMLLVINQIEMFYDLENLNGIIWIN